MAKQEREGVRVEVNSEEDGWVVARMYQGQTLEGGLEIARIRGSMLGTDDLRERFIHLINTGMIHCLTEAGHDGIDVRLYRSGGGH